VEEKARLRSTGALAVEMEAAALASRAEQWRKPFFCVRAVSDVAADGFALDLNTVRDKDGRFSTRRILAQALRRPVTVLPELVRLKRNSDSASRALGDFFADCSF
jgi:nucleoside phosphorylase